MIHSIRLDSDITEHWVWKDAEKLKWWLDLLFLAKPEKTECNYKQHTVLLERGQLCASLSELKNRWKRSVPTVLSFLSRLTQSGMIERKTTLSQIPIITICNYEQQISLSKETNNKKLKPKDTQLSLFTETIQKSAKECKHKYKPLVLLTEKEYSTLVGSYGKDGAQWMIKKLDDYKAARGMTYKSDYRAILNWVVKEYDKEKQNGISKQGNKAQRGRVEVTATSAEDYQTTF